MLETLTGLALSWGFPLLLAVLMSSGFGVPIPEDVPLLLTGFLCEREGLPVWPAAMGCYAVVMARDSLVFSAGRYLPERIVRNRWFLKIVPDRRQQRLHRYFARRGWRTVFAGRFMPGFRVLVFFVAGRSGLAYGTFLTADGVAGLISIPVLVYLGHIFAHQLPRIQERVHGIQTIIVVALVLYIAQGILRSWLRMRQSRRDDGESDEQAPA